MIEIAPNEQVLRIVRKHWFILLGDLFMLIACLAIPFVLLFALKFFPFGSFLLWSGAPIYANAFFLFAWFFIVWMIGWTLWTNYFLDVILITDKRVFTIEQVGLFKRTSTSFRIDRIQDTTVIQHGILQTLLHFGTIRIETAGEGPNFAVSYIKSPYELKKFLNGVHDQALERSQLVHTTPVITKENAG